VLPGLSSLVVEGVAVVDGVVRVRARSTRMDAACPSCGTESQRVHAWQVRHLNDLPVAGRGMVVDLRVRRLVCATAICPLRTFREQVPLLALRYARRTVRLTRMIGQIAVRLAGRAGSAVLGLLGVAVSRSTVLRTVMALPLPTDPVPPVLSVQAEIISIRVPAGVTHLPGTPCYR
jgi:hypothetical protein